MRAVVSSERPAHLAVLDALNGAPPVATDKPASADGAEREPPKPRLVSRAGPALPVTRRTDDSVPSGWMARLEAAKRGGTTPPTEVDGAPPAPQDSQTPAEARSASSSSLPALKDEPAAAPAAPPPRPPPLKKSTNGGATNGPSFGAKPAHLLVAELEAEESKKRIQARKIRPASTSSGGPINKGMLNEESEPSLADVEIPKPIHTRSLRHIPKWVPITVVIASLLGAGGIGFYKARQEPPPPPPQVDPKLAAEVQKKKESMAALEEGHKHAIAGKEKAAEAIAAYSKALKLDPKLAPAERGLAIAYSASDNDAAAVEHYKKYLELSPDASDRDQVKGIIDKWEKAQKAKEEREKAEREKAEKAAAAKEKRKKR